MRTLRKIFEIKDGVKVDALFTPHLYSFKGTQGIDFIARDDSVLASLELYADVIFCACLNAWVLDGHGEPEDFPHKRGDFHEWMAASPEDFGKAVNFAVEALTGKTLKELTADVEKQTPEQREAGKKKVQRWIGRRSKPSLSEPAD